MELIIQRLTCQNQTEVQELAKWFDAWNEWQKPYWTQKRIARRLTTMTKQKTIPAIFVAKLNKGPIVGTLGIDRFDDTKKNSQIYPWLVNGYVLPEYRHQGIYKKLLNVVEKYAKEHGYSKIYIRTEHNALYEKLGWQYMGNIVLDYGKTERLYAKEI